MKHLFIINPTAGGSDKTASVTGIVEKAFADRGSSSDTYEIYVTKAPLDATEKIRSEAVSGGHIRVYACGGDGTFNECVNGAALLDNVAVCPFPTGTGNDFCRMFGAEKDLYRNLPALLDGTERPIDLIDCNGRYSANICSVGIDARIGSEVHKYSKIPVIGGASAYVVSAIVNMFKGITRHMRVSCGDFYADGQHTLVCVCNGRFYGGGFNPSLKASPDDGILDMYVVKAVNIITFARLIGKYSKGKVDELPDYATHLRGDSITIEFDDENVINLDGEAMYAKVMEMKLVSHGLKLIIPAGMKFFDEQN